MQTVIFTAPAIECEGCAASIRRALGKAPGVGNVAVDVAQKRVTVAYDAAQVAPDALAERLTAAGFPAAPSEK